MNVSAADQTRLVMLVNGVFVGCGLVPADDEVSAIGSSF